MKRCLLATGAFMVPCVTEQEGTLLDGTPDVLADLIAPALDKPALDKIEQGGDPLGEPSVNYCQPLNVTKTARSICQLTFPRGRAARIETGEGSGIHCGTCH